MKKRILALLLTAVMLIGMLPMSVLAAEGGNAQIIQCETEGCKYAAGHEGNCSNYEEPNADEQAAAAVVALIDAIGAVTLDSEAAIAAADEAYNSLTDAQKVLVSNADALEAAKGAYSQLTTFAAPVSENGIVYTNDVEGTGWPAQMAYVNTVALEDVTVESYSWSGETCTVVLAAGTATDATVKFSVKLAGQAAGFNTTITAENAKGTKVTLVNGESTVAVTVSGRGVSGTKTFVLSIAGGGVKNDPPALKEGVDAAVTDTAYTGVPYFVKLNDIFEDAEDDAISYTVKENNGTAKAVDASYSYTPSKTGKQTLEFTASDGKESADTYKVTLTVKESSLALDKTEAEVDLGGSLTLVASVVPDGAAVIWSSEDESIATVANGVVTPVAKGQTVITAAAAGKSASCTVTVNDPNELKAKVTVTINNQGVLELIREPVTVLDQDNDGALTFHDALVILHEEYGKSYIAEASGFGLFVTTMWDVYTGGSNYFLIDNVPISYSVGTDTVKTGDNLYASNMADLYGFSDTYTYFDVSYKTVTAGTEFDLTLYTYAMDYNTWETVAVPAGGISVGTYSGYSGGNFTALGKTTDANGQVKLSFDKAGTYIVSATGSYIDEYGMECPIMPPLCIVTVKEAEVESVELNKTSLTMTIKGSESLSATVLPSAAADKSLTWTSSDESVATVSSYGKVTAKKAGTATITATSKNGKSASCLVTVELAEPAAPADVTVTISKQGVLALVNASVTVTDRDSDGRLTYDEAMIAVHESYCPDGFAINYDSGWVYRLWGMDTSNLLFFKNDKPMSYFIGDSRSVVSAGDSLYAAILMYEETYKDLYTKFAPKEVTVQQNEEFELMLSGYVGGHGANQEDKAVSGAKVGIWEEGVFTAIEGKTTDENGKVTLSLDTPGTYVISAYDNIQSAPLMAPVCIVSVEAPLVLESVSLNKSELALEVGGEETLTATVSPEGVKVSWKSSDESVAAVDDSGKVTAKKAGTATITATTESGKEASCTVTVKEKTVTYLSALKFTASTAATSAQYDLRPAFDPTVKEYTLIVPDKNTAVSVWATLADGQNGAKITAEYKNTSNKATSKTVKSGDTKGVSLSSVLKSGLDGNTLTIIVGGNEAFVITIVRKATLKDLTLSYGDGKTAALEPEFNVDKLEYSARVPQDAVITVAPSKKVAAAAVSINGAAETAVTPVWTGLTSEIEIVVSGGNARPEVVPTAYKVNLVQCAVSLEILTPPTKTEYSAGDEFDPTGMTLKATYSDGSTETIGADKFTCPEGALSPNTTEIEVSFDDLAVKQLITMPAVFEGEGTQEIPYLIKTAEDLVCLSELVADGLSFEGEYFKMMNDITLPAGWEPIGKSLTKPFSGNFDGGNHLLTVPEGGLPLIGTPVSASLRNLNVFGSQIDGFGVVNGYTNDQNKRPAITIDNVTLKEGTKTLKSGFIGGYASGENTVVITNSTVEKGVTIGYTKDQKWIGSFGGEFNGTISNCVSYADVYGTEFVGGIVADKGQTIGAFSITDCHFYGTVTGTSYVGGIVGHGYAGTGWGLDGAPNAWGVTIKDCSCSGTVTGESYVGGILGAERAAVQAWENGIGCIQNNRFTGKVSGSSYVGGIIGYYRSLNKYTVITGNYYASGCGADKGIGGVEYVDTSCDTHETASGATYVNTANGKPGISGFTRVDHNRTDDPLGADAAKLCYTDTQTEPVALELKVSGSYKTEYTEGEELDLSGIVLSVVYDKGESKSVELKDVTVSGYDKTKIGQQTVTLAYGGLTADITVTVESDGKITVSVSVLGDSVHNSDADGNVHTLAGGNLTTWISNAAIELEGGATAFDAVKKALDDKGISFDYSFSAQYNSHYIETINGLAEFTNGANSGWMITVNGAHINVGVSAYTLQNGDVIVMHYTDDYTKENGNVGGEEDDKAVDEVEKLIDSIGNVTLDKADEITAARKAYDALSYAQKSDVSNYAKLADAEKAYEELKKADDSKKAAAVEELIDKLDENSFTFEEDVKAAKAAYDKLSADQKKLVDNYAKLTAALKVLADEESREAAEKVEKLIRDIGTVGKDSEEKIKAAREAYEKLSEEEKALVENLAVLEAAEEKLEDIKALADVEAVYKATGDYLKELGTPSPGSVGGEWMVIGLLRSGRDVEDIEAYYEAAVKFVQDNADENERLHRAKSTENSRMILALTAMGADVSDVGGHDLLKGLGSMDYIRTQGINGPIWALIALDSGNYPVPEGDVSREALIREILDAQLDDGGWALSGSAADADMTGMALQALAPYYDSSEEVAKAVDRAVFTLSIMQNSDGSYGSIDGVSSESIAQVIAGLSALGIDPHMDARFAKNGVTALDALCAFFVEGGGFKHTPEGGLDGMATEQSYYALTAYFRMLDGKSALFDMTDVVDMGGDPVAEEEKALSAEPETTPALAQPEELVEDEGRSFPIWLVIVIVVLAGAVIVLAFAAKPKKRGR